MARSFFSYQITRPYPFKWFTWVTIVGGIFFTCLFSLVNYAAYGYELSLHYTTNPNQTFATSKITNAWPLKYADKISASCQPANIPIGQQFFTSQLALLYTITDVWQVPVGGSKVLLPSLTYLNNTLEDCTISFVQIELLAEDRTAEQFGWCQWGPSISAMAVCSIRNTVPIIMVNVTSQYDLLPPTVGNGQQSKLLTLDSTTKASLWWGASLISAYWMMLSDQMQTNRNDGGSDIRKGSINLQPSLSTNISSQDFFTIKYHFISETYTPASVYITANESITPAQLIAGNATNPPANIWKLVDIYGKSFYSTMLSDLGQTSGSTQPNLLTEAHKDLLQNYTSVFENMPNRCNAANGPATSSFDDESRSIQFGELQVTNSTIMQQYQCQIPKRRSTGALVVLILSSNLVFLQTVWVCFNLVTTWWLTKKDEAAMFCENAAREKGMKVHEHEHAHGDPGGDSYQLLDIGVLTPDGGGEDAMSQDGRKPLLQTAIGRDVASPHRSS